MSSSRPSVRKYPGGKFPKVHKMDNQQMAAIGRIMASKARTLADARPEWNVEIEKTINWLQWDKRSPEGELRSD